MIPLAVDLDGTLVQTDLLFVSVSKMLRRSPWLLAPMTVWLLAGRAGFKHKIAQRTDLDITQLPYHRGLLQFLHQQHDRGRTLVLATASHRKYAHQVADYLGIFHHVLASDQNFNLKAANKARALRELFGHSDFDYVGDSRADLAVWAECAGALLVEPTPALLSRARTLTAVKMVFVRDWRDRRDGSRCA